MRRQIIYVEDPTVKKKDTQSKQKPPVPLPRSTPNMDRPPRAGRQTSYINKKKRNYLA